MHISITTLPWQLGSREAGHGRGTLAILEAGLVDKLAQRGHTVTSTQHAELTADEQKRYGAWHKSGLGNNHLAAHIANTIRNQQFALALESDCTGCIGALAGVQQSGAQRVGMVWYDAHADFNTPETSLSGMLGGMPVACAAGLCLTNLRTASGLAQPIKPSDVVMVGLRDVDPLEMALLKEHKVEQIASDPAKVKEAVERLAQRVDAIYLHIDWDVLDPQDIPTAGLPVPNGPRLPELASLVHAAMHPKVVALGYAAYNADKDPQHTVAANLARNIADSL